MARAFVLLAFVVVIGGLLGLLTGCGGSIDETEIPDTCEQDLLAGLQVSEPDYGAVLREFLDCADIDPWDIVGELT